IPLIGALYRERAVEISVFGQLMVKRTVNDIIKAHEFTHHLDSATLLPHDTLPMLQAVAAMAVRQAHIDIGKLTVRHLEQQPRQALPTFLDAELQAALADNSTTLPQPKDIVLFGFGRIGRLVARLLSERTGGGRGMRLR